MSSTPSFTITPCTLSDGPTVASNNVLSFWTDKTWVQIWPGRTCSYVAAQAFMRGRHLFLRDRAHRRHLKAVDSVTGETLGYARWHLPQSDGCTGGDDDPCHALWREARIEDVDEETRREAEREAEGADWGFETGGDLEGIDDPITEMVGRLKVGKGYMELDYLCVPPVFRRRGIASALIRRGLEEAEKLGLDASVLAMRAGLGVYQRAGFVLLDHVDIDASDRGGDKDYGGWFLEKKCTARSVDEA